MSNPVESTASALNALVENTRTLLRYVAPGYVGYLAFMFASKSHSLQSQGWWTFLVAGAIFGMVSYTFCKACILSWVGPVVLRIARAKHKSYVGEFAEEDTCNRELSRWLDYERWCRLGTDKEPHRSIGRALSE